MRILVTNDDGVYAPGIAALARAVADAGHDVVVAGPVDDKSGSGAALGAVSPDGGITLERPTIAGLDDVPVIGIDGPPALAVMSARLGAFGPPPAIVVAGVNPGPNTGRAVLHSGTVGAALTAANFGCSGLAVSQGVGEPWHVATATVYAVRALAWLVRQPAKTVVNLNVPNLPAADVLGVRAARLAAFGTVRAVMREAVEGRLEMELRDTEERLADDTDTALVTAGYASVTLLAGIQEAQGSEAAAAGVVGGT